MNEINLSCAPADRRQWNNWTDIDWVRCEAAVQKLQGRIVKAQKEGRPGKVKALQWTLTHSFYAKALAVKRVTSNKGKNTVGVDKVLWTTPNAKMGAVADLKRRGYNPQPLRRVHIRSEERTAEQLLRWSPVPGSVRGEPGTNYRAQKNTLTMIGKGKSISHGVAALEYDLAKEINGQAVATEIARHELYGCTGAEMVQEMKPYHIDFPNVKNNCLRFEVSPSIEESATFTDADWAELGNDFMQRMGLANHQYIIIRHSGTESKKEQAHLHILANRVSLSGELYRDNWIGKKATEAANAIAKERNFVQSQDIGKVNKAEIKEAMDGVLKKMQGFDFTKFKEELGKRGFKVREARASTGKLNGYYVTARSGTEYKASEIGKGYTLAHIERTQSKLKCNSMNISHGNKLTPGSGSFQR